MRKTLKLLTLTGVAYLIAWTTASAQFEGIPDGLPVTDDDYLGDNQFSSDLLGDFELDTSVRNRFIHTILGPLVWDWDEATEMVILHTEWWGDLYTHLPDVSEENKHASGLGFTWPLVKSEITGAIYEVNVKADFSDPESTPFYNHRELNGEKIGWQRSIGVDLSSAENYYKSAETSVGQMQSILAVMVQLQRQYVDLVVSTSTGMGPIDQKFEEINAQFLAMHEIWVKFVFYYHRCALAPVWAEREGKSDAEITLAQQYANQLPSLETTALNVYQNGQEILTVNSVQIKTAKMNELNVKIAQEAAAAAAAAANSGGSSSGGSSSSDDSSSDDSSTSAPVTPPSGGGSSIDTPSGGGLIFSDDLQGSTKGTQYGGSISGEGYNPGRGDNHILYKFDKIGDGYVEFEVKGLKNGDFPSNVDHAFICMYDGRGVAEPVPYLEDFKNNYFRWNFHWRQNRAAFKCVITCAKPGQENDSAAVFYGRDHSRDWSEEPMGSSYSFDPNTWYKMTLSWKDKSFQAFVNGQLVWQTSGPYDYAPEKHYIRIGSGPDKYNSALSNSVYRNFKVYRY